MWHQMPLHVPKILLTFGAWASKDAQEEGSGKEEGNLIKMKQRPSITPLRVLLHCALVRRHAFTKKKKKINPRYYVYVLTKSVGGWQVAGGKCPRFLRVGEMEKKGQGAGKSGREN